MDINRENMTVFFEDLAVRFTEGYNAPGSTPILNTAGMVIPSTTSQGVHGWLKQIPQMREWLGDRQAKNLDTEKLTVVNRKFESTIAMPREDIEDDNHGMYGNLAAIMGGNAQAFKEQLLVESLLRGTTDTWVDDVAVFSAAGRSYGDNVINNYSTTAFDAAAAGLQAAYDLMVSYKGQNNQPLRVMPKYLLHGPALRTVAITAVEAQYAASLTATAATYVQNDNPNKGLVQRIQSEYLIDGFVDSKETSHNAANYWFLLGEIGPIRGLAYQDRKAPEIQQSRLSDDSDHVFEADEYQFGVRMRGAGFVTLPHLVYANFAA